MNDMYSTSSDTMVIDESGSLRKFYMLTNELSRNRHVRFIAKMDDADHIEWHFKYRGHPLALQYNIYTGVILMPEDLKDAKAATKLAIILKSKAV